MLSLHLFIIAFLFKKKAFLCLLGTNVWSLLNAFIILCEKMNVVPALANFFEVFLVKLLKANGYYLHPRTNRKIF